MRSVTIKVWIPAVPGTPGYNGNKSALFHRWGEELFEQTEGASVSYTVGIVEMEDGSVLAVPPGHVKFNEPPEA